MFDRYIRADLFHDKFERGRPTAMLALPLTFTADDGRKFVVNTGFVTDFASVPGWFRWALPSVHRYARAAVLHDWLRQTGVVPRKEAARLFEEAMRADGVGKVKRKVMFAAVYVFDRRKMGARKGLPTTAK